MSPSSTYTTTQPHVNEATRLYNTTEAMKEITLLLNQPMNAPKFGRWKGALADSGLFTETERNLKVYTNFHLCLLLGVGFISTRLSRLSAACKDLEYFIDTQYNGVIPSNEQPQRFLDKLRAIHK